ncbi:MAG TPA: transcriptional repressor NrdR [Clostridia bacterium]|nr:transcriptional repressor NrdR [Clostridia bacterium]
MRCPYCGYQESRVLDSRSTEEGSSIRRRRECIQCEKRFTTYERIEETPLIVIKKNGSKEVFNPQKILTGLLKACEKRPVSMERLENLVSDIEKKLRNSLVQEIDSQQIGEMVMEELREIDEVAFVRFASVYRQFKDINKFMEELEKLLNKDK